MTLIVRTLLSFSALQFSSGAVAQSPSDVFGLLGAIVQGAIAESLRTEWEAEPAAVIACLEAKGYGVSTLATHGIGPRDPRVRRLLRECRRPPSNDEQSDAILSTDPKFAIDGLGLGEDVRPTSDVYRSFRCSRSEQFATFIWCRRTEAEQGKLGPYKKTTSILHSETTLKAAYVSRSIEPAFFSENDIEREVDRLSRIFLSQPHIMKAPAAAGMVRGIIAIWGSVVLEPLDAENVAAVASRKSIKKGLLIDFLGNLQRSAQEGLPIYRIGGGPGYVYSANHNEAGKGNLRLTVSDSRMYDPPGSGMATATSPSAPSGDSALGGSRESENTEQSVQETVRRLQAELEAARQSAAEAENRRQSEAEAARRAAAETERRHQAELEAVRQSAAEAENRRQSEVEAARRLPAVTPGSQRVQKEVGQGDKTAHQPVTSLIGIILGLLIISGLLLRLYRRSYSKQELNSDEQSRAQPPESEHKWLKHKLAQGKDYFDRAEAEPLRYPSDGVSTHAVIGEGTDSTAASSRLDHFLGPEIQQEHSGTEGDNRFGPARARRSTSHNTAETYAAPPNRPHKMSFAVKFALVFFALLGILVYSFVAAVPMLFIYTILAIVFIVPSVVAWKRDSDWLLIVLIVNILFGWTVLGWGIALIIAVLPKTPTVESEE
ncbi:superinfection immunity protein [Methylocystis sp. H62]|uniref:superinfection immunity protein n=1 Tax=Methylocystis sp. H62 TaxID=2785789 RepID=UPI0018C2FD9D|nr:superinfection immunity protein [Methylocystis sp. H62]MBG0792851.1 superinfection immunity protein [Methylocystis sp. H62]